MDLDLAESGLGIASPGIGSAGSGLAESGLGDCRICRGLLGRAGGPGVESRDRGPGLEIGSRA